MPTQAPTAPEPVKGAPGHGGDGDVHLCPGCGAEVRIRRRDDGHTHTRRELTCPSCGTELMPAPDADDAGSTRTLGAGSALQRRRRREASLPWAAGGWRRIA